MRILVTGATGFIGLEVASRLAALGMRPRLMVRRPIRGMMLRNLDAELVQADLTSEVSLRRATRGIDAVIHLAARATFESYERVRPTIVGGSRALIDAAASSGVRHFVYASSLFVYRSQLEPIDGHTEPRPILGYGKAKLEAERLLATRASEAGIRLGCLRLPHVYGPRSLLFERVRSGRVVFPGPMRNVCGHLHVADAADALIRAALDGWTGTSPIADQEEATWRELIEVAKDFYPGLQVYSMPAWLASVGARAARLATGWRARPALTTPGTVTGFNLNLPVDSSETWRQLGLEPQYPTLAEGVPAVLDDSIPFRWVHPVADRAA